MKLPFCTPKNMSIHFQLNWSIKTREIHCHRIREMYMMIVMMIDDDDDDDNNKKRKNENGFGNTVNDINLFHSSFVAKRPICHVSKWIA